MPTTLKEIARLVDGRLTGDPTCVIEDALPIDNAGKRHITFAEKGPSLKRVSRTQAVAVFVPVDYEDATKNLIQVKNPRLAFAKTLGLFHPLKRPNPGIHPSAVIGAGCQIGDGVSVGAGAVLGDRVSLGDGVVLHALAVVGDDAVIGKNTVIHPHVSILERCVIGDRCIIHAGTVIGSDGFGFVQDGGRHHKIPQVGIVRIDDDVEIGAINTIDRASYGATWIQTGVKTDDQVHIGHNVVVGEHTILVAQVGIAGSTTIGHHTILAGKAAVSGHLSIGNEVIVGPRAGIAQSIPDKQVVSGAMTAMPHRTWLRLVQVLPKLPDLQKQVRQLEKRLAQIEQRTLQKS